MTVKELRVLLGKAPNNARVFIDDKPLESVLTRDETGNLYIGDDDEPLVFLWSEGKE